MDFRILGSFEVVDDDGAPLRIPAGRERALLALLLVNNGRVVASDAILEALWGRTPPATAGKAVQGYVSHLRRLLPDGMLLTRAPGYALAVAREDVDAGRFEALAGEGRRLLEDGEEAGAAGRLDEALALWRGPALADFAYDDFALDEIRRLEEMRLTAREDRAEALLATGRTSGLAADLDALVAAHPLRERLRSLAMLAMYREGRQADALELYERGRRALADELGVDPGRELAATHRAILNQDEALGAPRPVPRPRPKRRGRGLGLATAAIAAAAIAVLVVVLTRGDGGVEIRLPAVVAIDPRSGEVVASVGVGSRPVAVVADDGGAWVGDGRDGTLSRIDADTLAVSRTAGIGAPAVDLALGGGALWVATGGTGEIVRVDPAIAAVTRRVSLADPGAVESPTVAAVAVDERTVWAGARGGLVPIDLATSEPGPPVDLGAASALQIAVGDGGVWATTLRVRAKRVESASRRVTAEFYAGTFILPLALDTDDAVWFGAADEGRLWKVDQQTGATLLTARAGGGASGIAVGSDAVWVASWTDGTVVRLDRATGEVKAVIRVGGAPEDIAIGAGLVWVAVPSVEDAGAKDLLS